MSDCLLAGDAAIDVVDCNGKVDVATAVSGLLGSCDVCANLVQESFDG